MEVKIAYDCHLPLHIMCKAMRCNSLEFLIYTTAAHAIAKCYYIKEEII